MDTAEQIRAAAMAYLKQARAICDRIDRENRDFTDAERTEVADLLEKSRREMAKVQATGWQLARAGTGGGKAGDDDAVRRTILALGGGVGPDGSGRAEQKAALAAMSDAERKDFLERYPAIAAVGLGGGLGMKWSQDFAKHRGMIAGSKALIEPTGSVQVASPIDTLPGLGERVETLLQLLPTERLIGTDGVSFLRETVRTHEAAAVAAGEAKPESVYTVQRHDDRLRMVSHLSEPIPRQYLWSLTVLGRYLDFVLRQGLLLELERLIINGAEAVGDEFPGFLNTPGIQSLAFDTDVLITCRKAITSLELVSIQPGAYVFHPTDWETIELTEDLDENYKLKTAGQQIPVDRARRRLWGQRVALSLGITQGIGLLVDFRGSSHLWLGTTRVDWSEATYDSSSGKSDFERNLLRYRAEVEAFATLTRPAGCVEIDLLAGS